MKIKYLLIITIVLVIVMPLIYYQYNVRHCRFVSLLCLDDNGLLGSQIDCTISRRDCDRKVYYKFKSKSIVLDILKQSKSNAFITANSCMTLKSHNADYSAMTMRHIPDSPITVYRISDGEFIKSLGEIGIDGASCLALDSDCINILYVGHTSGTIKIWDYDKNICINEIHGHTSQITKMQFYGEDHQFYSASKDGTVKFWDKSYSCINTVNFGGEMVLCAEYVPKCQTLYVGKTCYSIQEGLLCKSSNSSFQKWNNSTILPSNALTILDCDVIAMALSKDEKYLAIGCNSKIVDVKTADIIETKDDRIYVYDLSSHQIVNEISFAYGVGTLCYNYGGDSLVCGALNGQVYIIPCGSNSHDDVK